MLFAGEPVGALVCGGLAVAAVGIVPEITAEMARITAYSAGAKLDRKSVV